VPLHETLGAFGKLIEQGKVRVIGASNYGADRFGEALKVSAEHGLPRYETLQPEYNLVSRKGYEKELEPLVIAENIGVINYYALASGFLSGKYRNEDDLAKSAARGGSVRKYLNAQGLGVLAALDTVAKAHNATPAQVALAWLIARPSVTAPIASATSIPQLKELFGAVELQLGKEEIALLDKASG